MTLKCPGWYCGRITLESECDSCPRGFRRNETSEYSLCTPCTDSPVFYDWLYLGFMVLLALVLHLFFIDMVCMRRSFSKGALILHCTAFLEVSASAIISLLLTPPLGSLGIRSCLVRSLSDWYTLLHNPMPNYEKRIHCTQEAVYPLYTLVVMFYAFCLLNMLLIRPWICSKFMPRQSKMSIYAAMYFLPILVLLHAIGGGLLYYAFPYLVVILSIISCAAHLAVKIEQSAFSIILTTITNSRNMVILLGHWLLHAYGIISITQFTEPTLHGLLLLLVPLPALFYTFTVQFTDPIKFR